MNDVFYYKIAGEASEKFEANRGLKQIKRIGNKSKKILDVGCGEGTRLSLLSLKSEKHGIDVNKYAIKLAQKKHPRLNLKYYAGKKLPYRDESFDLVYSAYVLEHTKSPYEVIDEIIRVTKKGGNICLITPNFGSPNRRSPNSTEKKLTKLLKGLFFDFLLPNNLTLKTVIPKKNI